MNWYPFYTLPRHEKKVAAALERDGTEYYLPLQKVLRKWSDRKKWVEEPLFKSYIFVRTRYPSTDFYKIISRPGIVRSVSFEGKPRYISDNEIDIIRQLLEKGYSVKAVNMPLKKGSPVEISGGPLMGLKGEVIGKVTRGKFIIRINTINTALKVDISADFLTLTGK
jgi:transcription antitermination factor NusG